MHVQMLPQDSWSPEPCSALCLGYAMDGPVYSEDWMPPRLQNTHVPLVASSNACYSSIVTVGAPQHALLVIRVSTITKKPLKNMQCHDFQTHCAQLPCSAATGCSLGCAAGACADAPLAECCMGTCLPFQSCVPPSFVTTTKEANRPWLLRVHMQLLPNCRFQ